MPEDEPVAHPADRFLNSGENIVYAFSGALLLLGAGVTLAVLCYHAIRDATKGFEELVVAGLDGLLLVFILLELLAGVRATMKERKLVAEPFMIVGIIASIKEIVLLTLQSKKESPTGEEFDNAMIEIGVLAGVIVMLALANYLVRRKEREPEEEEEDAKAEAE